MAESDDVAYDDVSQMSIERSKVVLFNLRLFKTRQPVYQCVTRVSEAVLL